MFKKIYIVLILVVLMLSFVSVVRAGNIDMDIQNNPSATTSQSQVSPLSSLPEASLGLTNIVNILLIAVGVILIFLAIAILIKMR